MSATGIDREVALATWSVRLGRKPWLHPPRRRSVVVVDLLAVILVLLRVAHIARFPLLGAAAIGRCEDANAGGPRWWTLGNHPSAGEHQTTLVVVREASPISCSGTEPIFTSCFGAVPLLGHRQLADGLAREVALVTWSMRLHGRTPGLRPPRKHSVRFAASALYMGPSGSRAEELALIQVTPM
jgi:hypothetical protein